MTEPTVSDISVTVSEPSPRAPGSGGVVARPNVRSTLASSSRSCDPSVEPLHAHRPALELVLRELYYWYPNGCPVPATSVTLDPFTDSAQHFKDSLMKYGHLLYGDHPLSPALSHLRSRLHWSRLRVQGRRTLFLVVYTSDGYHRMLVLKVPPRKFSSPSARWTHASRQMTFHDTADGLYGPGVRYREPLYDHFLDSESELRDSCHHGHRMNFVSKPLRFKRDNHPSCYEHVERSQADLERSALAGVLEGPLHYEPWAVTQIGSIYLPEKDKFRNVWNGRSSGVNRSMAPATVRYDYLEDVLSLQRPACLMSGWDLKDAFWNNPRWQPHCDYMGVQFPLTKGFYRARYDMFGFADAPQHQADMARVLKRYLNATVHSDGRSQCTGIFVDDGHTVHDSDLGLSEATARTEAELRALEDVGVWVSAHKTHYPSLVKDYIGREIHSVPRHVTASGARVEKYTRAADELLGTLGGDGSVSRRSLAAVVGKFQFLAPLVKGGQNLLAPIYRARDSFREPFVAEWDPGRQWVPDVEVQMDAAAVDGVRLFTEALRRDPLRRYYLYEGRPEISGWWTGRHSGDRWYLTEHWATPEGVSAPVMDASGWQGGIALRGWRHIVDFPVHERAPHMSSNFREASTAASAVELLGPSYRGGRLLLWTDNTTTMSLVNKQGTMAPDLWPVCQRMFAAAAQYDLDLAAEHIPGVENGLSDGLSRYVRRKDYSDWQFRRDEFESIQRLLTAPFTLDGGADPVGTNAHLPRYRSLVDSFMDSTVDGEHVYSNPDYSVVREYLEHFLRCQRRSPHTTSGTFVLPVWDTCDWWPLLKGAHVLRLYPARSDLFTSPEWRQLGAGSTVRQLRELVLHLHSELGGWCQCLRGTRHVTECLCLVCHRLLCRSCAGVEVGLTGMVRCVDCWLLSTGWGSDGRPLVRLVAGLLALRTRPTTDVVHARGVRDMSFFLGHFGGTTLPATPEDVLGYAGYAVELREFRLDSSTMQTYLSGVSAWHSELGELLRLCGIRDDAGQSCSLSNPCKASVVLGLLKVLDKYYKKPSKAKSCWTLVQWVTIFRYGFLVLTRHGRHNRLLFLFCTVGCLRPTGTRYLRVFYRLVRTGAGVSVEFLSPSDVTIPHVVVVRGDGDLRPYVRGRLQRDKNVDARRPRYFYLPEHIPGLCCSPVALLEEYVLREGVPSGGLLFAAPKGARGWYSGPYMGHGRAFVRAYCRAYPGARDGHLYGGGSARKSLGQWLWTYGWASRMISDVGGQQGQVWPPELESLVRAAMAAVGGRVQCMSIGGHYLCDPYRMAMATELPDGDTDSDDVVSSCDCSMCRRERDGEDSDSGSGFDSDYY
ncbi:hypothetical protein CYMTET_47968 [Cymbomonas tetramitiformis]|uniref:Reverse transcriptase domain-containing protein n=1 Tax=Cymbomonas tetramitiformis TaxID=36881 RepID=A0AAE0EW40_9CHLO|nr:hypothetical protein CYMTET_47968 [Cymbomonas tetramitiformis]